MPSSAAHYRWGAQTLWLHCLVQPGARRSAIVGVVGQHLKVQIAAPPQEGRANARLIEFIAAEFGVARAAVRIEWGLHGRRKTLAISDPRTLPATAQIAAATG